MITEFAAAVLKVSVVVCGIVGLLAFEGFLTVLTKKDATYAGFWKGVVIHGAACVVLLVLTWYLAQVSWAVNG